MRYLTNSLLGYSNAMRVKHGLLKRDDYGRINRPHEYRAWLGLKRRVKCPEKKCYEGITVCDRWLNSYENFLEDMGASPTDKHQVDRIKNELGYSPDNCRWATRVENARNKTNNRVIEWRGESLCLAEWQDRLCPLLGVSRNTMANRLAKGWSIEKAFTTPVHANQRRV